MTFQGDPYRTLGLAPGASVNEIRSAYRRMAKRYHPDTAGERAVPRFLAIQRAYEALVDANGNLRREQSAGPAGPAGPVSRTGGAGEPWRADPARAQASRDAWRARGRSGSPGRGGGPGSPSGASAEPRGPDGAAAGPGDRRQPGGRTEHHHRRHRRAATPGSTTYDEAAETPLDPAWEGGTWYGASSGTYWTLNPREYADPRKHGPEYRRRAWRAAGQPGRSPQAAAAAESPPAPPRPAPDRPAPEAEAEPMADTTGAVPGVAGAHVDESERAERRPGPSFSRRLVARLLGRHEVRPPRA